MGHKISKEQIDPGVKDHIMSFVGDIADLETEVNTDIISAVNSLMVDRVDNAENMGKLANAIGEPVTANHSVDEVVEGLGEMLSTFKTNMMNSGVTVESGDKFKQLIEKIKGLTEGEGNKGIQFAEGLIGTRTFTTQNVAVSNYTVITNLGFTPSIVFIGPLKFTQYHNLTVTTTGAFISNLANTNPVSSGNAFGFDATIKNVTSDSFNFYYAGGGTSSAYTICNATEDTKWYAIGIGEEDTTLRDSLADILENKGVDVTEEDDIASLITKVDSISGGLNIISATELPATGKENQICVITDNPVDSFLLTSKFEDKIVAEDTITIYISNEASFDLIEGTLVPITNGNLTTNYYFCKICQGENRLASYIYQNNEWKQLTQDCIYFLEKGYCLNTEYYGNFNLGKSPYTEGQFIYLFGGDNTYPYGFTTKKTINLSLYSKVEVTVKGTTTTSRNLYVGAKNTSAAYAQNIGEYKYYVIGDKKIEGEQTYLISFDISNWTGEYYFTIFAENKTGYAYITDIALY